VGADGLIADEATRGAMTDVLRALVAGAAA
jgi:hypothetical protein